LEQQNKNYGKIQISDGTMDRCPQCNSVYLIRNAEEELYRNISILHRKRNNIQIKCKQCKKFIDIIST
jgi:uncharacterized protein with PIN domain